MQTFKDRFFYILILGLMPLLSFSQINNKLNPNDFINPPSYAKPYTWMHVMNGNMSKEGMLKDLEAIKSVGIGGVLLFDISHNIPKGKIEYGSKEHLDILKYTAKECERLGLGFGIHNCAGWSSSGGPWITPKESMKMLVCSNTIVNGGAVKLALDQPTTRENYYNDIAILAYPTPESEIVDKESHAIVSSPDTHFNKEVAFDKKTQANTMVNGVGKNPPTIYFDYGKSFPLRSLHIVLNCKNIKLKLFSSDNGVDYKLEKTFKESRVSTGEWAIQQSFAKPINKRYFKLEATAPINLLEINFSASSQIDDFINKISWGRKDNNTLNVDSIYDCRDIIKKKDILDLTSKFKNGILTTNLPKGKWTIMRIGFTSTSSHNRPASSSGRGLECDKLSKEAFDLHFNAYCKKVIDEVHKVAPNAQQYLEIDSYEMGGQNWTDNLDRIFKTRTHYDLIKFLPAIFGKCVENVKTTESVLSDFRNVCCDLMDKNYYGEFDRLCKENGVKSYVEPYGCGVFNCLDVAGHCDLPMCEFWMSGMTLGVPETVSGAHTYGKNIISSESFTSGEEINWRGHPAMAKPSGDWAWKQGINQFMFHRFVHQPNTNVRPGMTMSKWGFHIDRNQTWWNNAGKDWFKYITRGSYMLRLGVPVADILCFVGDEGPTSSPTNLYNGYKRDGVNSDVLLNRVQTKKSEIVLPEGTTYKILSLENCNKIKLSSLNRICEIAESGVPVIGDLPKGLLGNVIESADMIAYESLISRIKKCNNYYDNHGFSDLIQKIGLHKDFQSPKSPIDMEYFHRHLSDGTEIYFISNPDSISHNFNCQFRVDGYVPELWYAMNGEMVKSDNYSMNDGVTSVNISLNQKESVFVVFREKTMNKNLNTVTYTKKNISTLSLNNNWMVKFDKDYGYDKDEKFDALIDWSQSTNQNVKFYSGTAVYSKHITLKSKELSTSNIANLNLGDVDIAAEVYVNGKYAGVLWMAPFQIDVYKFLQKGDNLLEIKVTNQWTNRLIGDERFPKQDGGYIYGKANANMPDWYLNNRPIPKGPRMTFSATPFYTKDSPLLKAGLLGPVTLELYRDKQ